MPVVLYSYHARRRSRSRGMNLATYSSMILRASLSSIFASFLLASTVETQAKIINPVSTMARDLRMVPPYAGPWPSASAGTSSTRTAERFFIYVRRDLATNPDSNHRATRLGKAISMLATSA